MSRLLIATVLLLTAIAAPAEQRVLTEELALQLGLNRDLVQHRLDGDISQAQSEVLAASTWPNPEFSYEREALEGLDLVEQKIIISQEFDFSGRRGLHMQAADLHMDAAKYKFESWRRELIQAIRERFYDALLQQKRQEAHDDMRKRLNVLSKALTRRYDEGDVSVYDYQRVIAERTAVEAQLSNANVDFTAAWLSLRALLGESSDEYRMLKGDLLPATATTYSPSNLSLEDQPNLRQLRTQSEAFDLQNRAETRTFPDVTLGLGWKRDEVDGRSDDGLIINASIPIPLFDKRRSDQYRYKAKAMIARSEYELAKTTASAELKGLWQQSSEYRKSALKFRNESTRAVDELIEIAETYYRAGEIGIIELLDAYRSALNAELTALELEFKARTARVKLDYLTGDLGSEQD